MLSDIQQFEVENSIFSLKTMKTILQYSLQSYKCLAFAFYLIKFICLGGMKIPWIWIFIQPILNSKGPFIAENLVITFKQRALKG